MHICLRVFSILLVILFISCEGPDTDSNWKERDDFIGPNGKVITGEQAEQAGLVIYNILKWILKTESFDTLAVYDRPLPWVELEGENLHLDWLQKIKDSYTFTKKKGPFNSERALPTFFYKLGTFPKDDDHLKGIGHKWLLKNHKYKFQNSSGADVPISFFIEPSSLKVRTWTVSKGEKTEMEYSVKYEAEMIYEPRNEDEVISSGEVSFDIFAKTGYVQVEVDDSMVGSKIDIGKTSVKIIAFKKDFAVFEKLSEGGANFGAAAFAKDGNQYRTRPVKKQLQLYNGKAGKLNVSKIVWEYVESRKYQLDKEEFLQWFATNILTNVKQYSDVEKQEQYAIVYSIGDMDRLTIYSKIEEKLMSFNMKLK